ncbi:MAG: hypothetical protein ACREFZ_03990 [Acetobacteraceae bacterium]
MRDGNFAAKRQPRPVARDVFLYFDNTGKVRAPHDARKLMARLDVPPNLAV